MVGSILRREIEGADLAGGEVSYLRDLELKRAVEFGQKALSEAGRLNVVAGKPALGLDKEWDSAMKVTAHAQCSGVLGNLSEAQRDFCEIFDPKISLINKLAKVEAILASADGLAQLQTIHEFFNAFPVDSFKKPEEQEILRRIRENRGTRDRVIGILDALQRSPVLSMELMLLGQEIGWLNEEEYQQRMNAFLKKSLRPDLSTEEVDTLCSQISDRDFSGIFKADDIPAALYDKPNTLRLLGCVRPKDPAILQQLVLRLQKPALAATALSAIRDTKANTSEIQNAVANLLDSDNPELKRTALEAVREMASKNPLILGKLTSMLGAGQTDYRRMAMSALAASRTDDPAILRKIAGELGKKGATPEGELESLDAVQTRAAYTLLELKKSTPANGPLVDELLAAAGDQIRAVVLSKRVEEEEMSAELRGKIISALAGGKLDQRQKSSLISAGAEKFPDDESFRELVVQATSDKDQFVRISAAKALQKRSSLNDREIAALVTLKNNGAGEGFVVSSYALLALFVHDPTNAKLAEELAARMKNERLERLLDEFISPVHEKRPADPLFRAVYLQALREGGDASAKHWAREALSKFVDLSAEERAAIQGTSGTDF